jgi:hypothetical protein
MSGINEGLGWLPVDARDALAEEQARASAKAAEALLAMDPRARAVALMVRAACRGAEEGECPPLTAADLARVLESFPGVLPVDEAAIARHFAAMLVE